MKTTKAAIKAKFSTGQKPTQTDYGDWIDSFVHLDDQQAVDAQIVSTLIAGYDNSLKSRNENGTVDTLGDLLYMFSNVDDATKMTDIFHKIDWIWLPNKPDYVNLYWLSEQTVVTDSTTYNPLGSSGSAGSGPSARWLGFTVGGFTTQKIIILDIKTDRHWIPIGVGGDTGVYADQIVALKIGVTPRADLR